jgi:hypothetical protein
MLNTKSFNVQSNKKKALLRTGRPLTIACHMKKTYFLVVSTFTAEVSAFTAEVSGVTVVAVSGVVAAVSVLGASAVPLSLQDATNAPIAKTNRSFFICPIFVIVYE